MIEATIYENNGRIVSSMRGSAVDIQAFITDAENYIEGHYTEDLYYINTETKEAVLKPEKPSSYVIWNYNSNTWSISTEELALKVREHRNWLIRDTDWTMTLDAPLTQEQKDMWSSYRQALRDITNQLSNISTFEEVVWPVRPTA